MPRHDDPAFDTIGDEQFVTAVVPDVCYTQPPSLKHPPNIYASPTNYYYPPPASSPAISSPEARMSVSGSSTGSYSLPRANLDASIPHPEKVVSNIRPQPSHSPRTDASAVADSYTKEERTHSPWSARMSSSDGHHPRSTHEARNSVTVYTSDKEHVSRRREPNAVLVLLLLSAPIPLFSLGTALYTFFALFLVIFTTPLRLCPPSRFFRSTTFSTQFCQLLAPAFRYHERLAQSSQPSHHRHHHHHGNDPYSADTDANQFSPVWLSLVLTLAPILSLGLLLAVWTAAFFWIFAMILGNPDGTEKKDDGRVAVLGVNAWWQTWLRKSRKRQ